MVSGHASRGCVMFVRALNLISEARITAWVGAASNDLIRCMMDLGRSETINAAAVGR